jgi:hypothetical protein
MSAPIQEFQRAKFLDYAFLAAKAEKAAGALIANTPLSTEDRTVLSDASKFLQQVATGAKALSTGNYQVGNFTAAMEALEFAMNPLEELSAALNDRDVSLVLTEAASVISAKIAEQRMVPLNEAELREAGLFQSFFDLFYRFILDRIDQTNRVAILGARGRFESATLAVA